MVDSNNGGKVGIAEGFGSLLVGERVEEFVVLFKSGATLDEDGERVR